MDHLEFFDDGSGNLTLSDQEYEGCQFSELVIRPTLGQFVTIRKVKFVNCVTSPGTCVIRSGVSLNGVIFSNCDCGDALRISSEVTMREVVVAGARPKTLIIQPEQENGFIIPAHGAEAFQLDVTEFLGEVSIVGIRGNMVRKDGNRHVTIKSRWKDEVNWKELGIGPFSYWRLFIKKLTAFNVEEGVFTLPDSLDKHYAETVQERKRLEQTGLCFA